MFDKIKEWIASVIESIYEDRWDWITIVLIIVAIVIHTHFFGGDVNG